MTVLNVALKPDNIFHQISDFVNSIFRMLKTEWQSHQVYTRTLHELSRLTDRELDDIGVQRFDIQTLAKEAAAEVKNRPSA